MTKREQIMELAEAFDSVAHLLQPAVERNPIGFTLEDIKEKVLTGYMQLWKDEGYAAVTEVLNYPGSRVVLVHLAGGELEALLEADSELVKFARMVGATGIEIIGRKGWVRALRDRGYREAAVHLFKEV